MDNVKIIDYGMGNLASVKSAVEHVGGNADVIDAPDMLGGATHVILPGVGSFTKAMANLNDHGWPDALRSLLASSEAKLLGICLGMQLLAEKGTEHGETDGLNLIGGHVVHFDDKLDPDEDTRLLVPHVGWNEIHLMNRDDPLIKDIASETDFYFVHSYIFDAAHTEHVVTTTPYGIDFPSIVRSGRVWGAQFHPEKSDYAGFQILKNFLEMN
jgi:glutamine amidotransferase